MSQAGLCSRHSGVETREGGAPADVTRDRAFHRDPAWSPDGRYLLFSSDRTGVFDVYAFRLVYRAADWEVEQSTVPGTFIVTLRTPDGFHISFALSAADLSDMAHATHEPTPETVPSTPKQRSVH